MNPSNGLQGGAFGQSIWWFRPFLYSAGAILGLTGGAKILSVLGSASLLDLPDPIFGFSFRHLLLVVGLIEASVAAMCLATGYRRASLVLVAWLAASFLAYRTGLWWIGWEQPCRCLGRLTEAIHISQQAADLIAIVLLAYLLLGCAAALTASNSHRVKTNRCIPP